MDFEIGVVGVGLAREQRFDLPALRLSLEGLQQGEPLFLGCRIGFGFAELDEGHRVFELAFETGEGNEPLLQLGAFAHYFLRGLRVVPEIWVLGFRIEFGEASRRSFDVKDASSAGQRTA